MITTIIVRTIIALVLLKAIALGIGTLLEMVIQDIPTIVYTIGVGAILMMYIKTIFSGKLNELYEKIDDFIKKDDIDG